MQERLGLAVVVILALLTSGQTASDRKDVYGKIIFPSDASVLDVRRDFGAKGDGQTDDTAALQRALDASTADRRTRVVYLPDGVYRVRKSLVYKHALGPWMYGQSRSGVIIRLDDGAGAADKTLTAVLRTHPNETGPTSSDWFMRNIRNLTIDVGDNPTVDGIRYYATNSGIVKNVVVRGRGKVGVHTGFHAQSGPSVLQDVVVEGFETGIVSVWTYGQTLSRITVRNCRTGLVVSGNSAAIEDLVVEDTALPLHVQTPNNWDHWAGVAALIGGRFAGARQDGPAIINEGILYARDVRVAGFGQAIRGEAPGTSANGDHVAEYLCPPARRLWDNAPSLALKLPVRSEPIVPWETDPDRWVCVSDYGAVAGDNQDDTAAFQKAIDAAAASGKTIVYLRGCGGPDPNWYNLNGEVHVRGSVRWIIGLGFGRVLGTKDGKGRFVVDDESAAVVKFQNIDSFGGPPATIANCSGRKTVVIESCGAHIWGQGTGDIFATDCPALVTLERKGQSLWARSLNAEGASGEGQLVLNRGANLWVLGTKSEGFGGVRYRTIEGGRTEVFGMFQYTTGAIEADDRRPLFDTVDASTCVMGLREICHIGKPYVVKARETRAGTTRELTAQTDGGWTGWSLYSGWSGE